jgi:Spy/CpxP family protein refolding chaperone
MIALIAIVAFTLGACYPRDPSPEARVTWAAERVAGYLDLDRQQKRQLDRLRDELIYTSQDLREDGRTTGEEILVMLADDKMDRDKAMAVVTHRLETMKARAPELVNRFGDFYDSLNPEQQAEVRKPVQKYVARYAAYREK